MNPLFARHDGYHPPRVMLFPSKIIKLLQLTHEQQSGTQPLDLVFSPCRKGVVVQRVNGQTEGFFSLPLSLPQSSACISGQGGLTHPPCAVVHLHQRRGFVAEEVERRGGRRRRRWERGLSQSAEQIRSLTQHSNPSFLQQNTTTTRRRRKGRLKSLPSTYRCSNPPFSLSIATHVSRG